MPVVVLTGMEDDTIALQAVRDGAQDFLVKGHVDGPRLIQAMRYAIERQRHLRRTKTRTEELEVKKVASTQVMTDMERLSDTTVAGYEIHRILGEGSMATVYLAESKEDHRRYALKVMKSDCLNGKNRDALMARFFREAEVAASIDHPSVVRIFDFGRADSCDSPYIVMELVNGQTIQSMLRDIAALDTYEKAYIIQQSAEALAAIHALGITHRDVKPGNIMIDEKLNVKVTDFGIALIPGSDLTIDLHLIGSPAYMSPEAFRSPKIDFASDIFSLGVVAYEFLLGKRPFDGETIAQLAHQVQNTKPNEPRKLAPDFPMALQTILARMLKKQIEHRYGSAKELSTDLQAYLQHKSSASFIGNVKQRFLSSDWS